MPMSDRLALAATTALVLALSAAPVAAYAQAAYDFDLPAQPLADTLRAIGSRAGVNVAFDPAVVRGRQAPALRGSYSPRDALARALDGSGLTLRTTTGGAFLVEAVPLAAAAGDESTTVDQLVVTGTHIRDAAPTSPVITIDRTEIERNGYATVQDVVAKTPQNFSGTTAATPGVTGGNVGFSNQIDLRGLGSEATLTLVNGRRVAGAAGDQGRAVDISMIPLAAVERVDILTDGASALYGSDAIGGVVNLVLRDDYDGAEVSAQYGYNEAGADSFLLGGVFGARWSTGRLVVAGQYDGREALRYDAIGITTLDFTDRGGGDFRISTFGNPGTLLPAGFFGGQPFATITGPGGSPVFFAALPADDGRNLDPGDLALNQFNFSDPVPVDATPRQRNGALFATIEQDVGPVTLFADAAVSSRESRLRTFAYFDYLFVPTSNAFSPFLEPVMVGYDLDELGPITNFADNLGWFVNAGGRGSLGFGDWTWEAVGTLSEDKTTTTTANFVDSAELNARLASSDPSFAFNPFGDGTGQSAGVIDAIRQDQGFRAHSALRSASALFQGGLFEGPGGTVRLALGAELRSEELSGHTEVDGVVTQELFTNSSRDVRSVYGELYAPIVGPQNAVPGIQELALSLAARYDDYSDFGGTTNPKVGVRWRPFDGFVVKANYGTSFRAPSLRELHFVAFTFPNIPVFDPNAPGGPAQVFIDLTQGGNPNLRQETAQTWTVSAEYRPPALDGLRLSANYFHIDYNDRIRGVIDGISFPLLLQFEDSLPPGIVVRDAGGVLQSINLTNINSAATVLSGFDLAAGYNWSTDGWGSFDLGASATFVNQVRRPTHRGLAGAGPEGQGRQSARLEGPPDPGLEPRPLGREPGGQSRRRPGQRRPGSGDHRAAPSTARPRSTPSSASPPRRRTAPGSMASPSGSARPTCSTKGRPSSTGATAAVSTPRTT